MNIKIKSDIGDLNSGFAVDYAQCADAHKPLRAAMICVDFDGARAEDCGGEEGKTSYYKSLLSDDGLDVFKRISFGRLDLKIDFYAQWFHMPKKAADYNMARVISWETHRNYIEAAMKISESEVNYASYDILYIAAIKSAPEVPYSPTMVTRNYPIECASGKIGLCVTFGADMHFRRGRLLAHETGHIMGLPDLYTYEVTEGADGVFGHCGAYDLMGLIEAPAPDYLAWHKWRLGFIDDDKAVDLAESGNAALTPVESVGGVKLAVIRTGEYDGVAFEYRRGEGLDLALGGREGVLAYKIDGRLHSGRGCVTVIPPEPSRLLKLNPNSADELIRDGIIEANGKRFKIDGANVALL